MWPIFVISLRDQAARRRQIAEQLSRLGLDFAFVDAVDGRIRLPDDQESKIDRRRTLAVLGREMVDAEYACALSHMSVYETVVARGLEGAIVLEDDAMLRDGFAAFLDRGRYRDFDLLQFDYYSDALVWSRSRRELGEGLAAYRLFRNVCLSNGYAISRRGAEYVMRKGRPICATADWPCDMTWIGASVIHPRLVVSSDAQNLTSAIEAARLAMKQRGMLQASFLTRVARRLKLELSRPLLRELT